MLLMYFNFENFVLSCAHNLLKNLEYLESSIREFLPSEFPRNCLSPGTEFFRGMANRDKKPPLLRVLHLLSDTLLKLSTAGCSSKLCIYIVYRSI